MALWFEPFRPIFMRKKNDKDSCFFEQFWAFRADFSSGVIPNLKIRKIKTKKFIVWLREDLGISVS